MAELLSLSPWFYVDMADGIRYMGEFIVMAKETATSYCRIIEKVTRFQMPLVILK